MKKNSTEKQDASRTLLRSHYQKARDAERLLADPDTPSDVRAQLETAILEAAEAMGVSVLHPALVRQAFLEIMRQSAENFRTGVKATTHHFACPVIRLLHVVAYGDAEIGPLNLADEDRTTRAMSKQYGENGGLEAHSYKALKGFIDRAAIREFTTERLSQAGQAGREVKYAAN